MLKSPELQQIIHECSVDSNSQHTIKDGLLYFKNKLRVASDSSLKTDIINEFHSTPMSGHAGILNFFLRISANF